MNCSEHPNMVVNSRCDVCHKPFCPSCLQDDRGRFVCKRCFDPANQPRELAWHKPDVPVLSDEEKLARIEAVKVFWESPKGVWLQRVGNGLLIVLWISVIYTSFLEKQYVDLAMFVFVWPIIFLPRLYKGHMK